MRKNPVVWALILVVRGLIAIVRSSPRNWGRILLNIPDLIFDTNINHNCPVISAHLEQNIEDIYLSFDVVFCLVNHNCLLSPTEPGQNIPLYHGKAAFGGNAFIIQLWCFFR